MGFRRAARVDANQNEIVSDLRRLMISVLIISQLKNCADIIVGYRGKNYIIELKVPGGKTTPGQDQFKDKWKGQCAVCTSLVDVLRVIGFEGLN